ncbi:MAG: RelA/SpoT family protein [Candidatus Kerfeldbacteria bacterium]
MTKDDIVTVDGQTFDDLISIVADKNPDANLDLLRLAYDFAKDAHEGQMRKSGDPYVTHPLATAITLAQLGLDDVTIAAGLLHDVPEDTDRTLKEVKKEFGREIASLVEGITKLGQLKYRGIDRYVENLRRMFIAMAKDARVILIKFADRINNLKTLDALPPEKRRRIALESMEIYAQIANRLGMGEIKGQLEDLAFPYVYPEEYQWMTKKVVPRFKEKEKVVDEFIAFILEEFAKRDLEVISIHGRAKHLYSLYRKLLKNNRDLSKIYDLVAIRIIVENVAKCYETLGNIHEICKPLKGRIKDYIAQPKPNGYQSLHTTVFSPPHFAKGEVHGEIVEIQIRTNEMHEDAEYGIAAHWKYKENVSAQRKMERRMDWMQELLTMQKDVKDKTQFLETLKIDIFQNYIFVFTPRGDVIELPEDSTPVDFAFKIHTDLGMKCSGVKINDHIASLNTKLKSGDVVDISIDPHRKGPSADWLNFVKTNSARAAIRAYVNKKNRGLLSRKAH